MFHTIYSTSCEQGRTVACVSMMPVRLIVVPFVIGGVRRLSLPNVVCVKFRSYALHIACRGRVVGFLHRPRSSGDSPRETLINGPTSEVAGEMASNFLDDEA
ncbi:hypothetical protein, partial [Burkholderia cepacia]|uniref:hypothetical protein n=1 Tax=Burkholderia cepacia TaxID=292 RepID=UPI001C727035